MKCDIMAIGTELLLGNIANTNAQYLSEEMAKLGIDVFYHIVVGDNLIRASDAVKASLDRSDVLIITGGLGPTDDDLTKEAVCKAFGIELVPHETSLEKIRGFFDSIGRPMPQCNLKQGYIPEGSRIIENYNGTAPGVILEKNSKTVVLLPGPPRELIPMFEASVVPLLRSKSNTTIRSKTLRVVGVGESAIQEMLRDVFENQGNPTIAPYAKTGEVHLRLTAKANNEQEAYEAIEKVERQAYGVLGNNIYSSEDISLEEVVLKLLKNKNMTISTAESCTGGLISSRLTDIPGSSASFMNGVVSYSNEAKQKLLGVKEATLQSFGAVSEEVAKEMALGIKQVSGTDIGVSVTGIAGPDGGSEEKPVGLAYIGIAYLDKIEVHRLMFPGNRTKIKWVCSTRALDLVRRVLLKIDIN